MKGLIEALTIFLKYKDNAWPTHCEHDTLYVVGITKKEVSEEDRARLDELGFFWDKDDDDNEDGSWISFRYGSA